MVSPQPQILLDVSIKHTVKQARIEILRRSPGFAYRLKMLQKCSLCSQFQEVKAKVEGHIRFNWCSLATSITNPHPHPHQQLLCPFAMKFPDEYPYRFSKGG